MEAVPVVRQRLHRNRPGDRNLVQFHLQPEPAQRGDPRREGVPQPRGQVTGDPAFEQRPLRRLRRPLRPGTTLGECGGGLPGRQRAGALPVEVRGERPVGEEVRVAADGRGEVEVVRQRQREVALVPRRIPRQRHRPEHPAAQERGFPAVRDPGQQPGEVRRAEGGPRRGQPLAERGEQVLEPGRAIRRRGRVRPEERRESGRSQPFRDRLVGEQHELLHQPVRLRPFRAADPDQVPALVGLHRRLRQVEVHRPPAPPGGRER